ncbi:MAG TPA: hypothetical protein VHM01_11465 [Alphaproteobacteria bacterium]|nr:hypothetical protein [Alphaproteobacteria bacterium]
MHRTLSVFCAAALIGIGAAAAQTSPQSGPMSRPTSTPQGAAPGQSGTILSEVDVREKLTADGYTNIGSLKREGNRYSANAMKDGRQVSLSIDARTGAVQSNTVR